LIRNRTEKLDLGMKKNNKINKSTKALIKKNHQSSLVRPFPSLTEYRFRFIIKLGKISQIEHLLKKYTINNMVNINLKVVNTSYKKRFISIFRQLIVKKELNILNLDQLQLYGLQYLTL